MTKGIISEVELENVLYEGLEFMLDHGDLRDEKISIQTYEEAGLLTNDKGIALSIGNEKYQITIVRVK